MNSYNFQNKYEGINAGCRAMEHKDRTLEMWSLAAGFCLLTLVWDEPLFHRVTLLTMGI